MRGTRATFGMVVAAAVVGAVLMGLVACAPEPAAPTSSAAPTVPPPTEGPVAPTLDPDSAQASKAYFDATNEAVIAENSGAHGRDFIDGLVAAGFVKADMEVTADTTPAGKVADSIQFSVRMGDSCLIGQYGQSTGYVSDVTAVTATGTCLIGATRPIDW